MKYTGDRPVKGTYICMACGRKIVIEDDEKEVATCPQ